MGGMCMNEILKRITDVGVVAVVRAENEEEAFKIAEACIQGGLPAIELTFTVPNAHLVIKKLSEEIPESDLILGAGTVLNEDMATLAIEAGAKYNINVNAIAPGYMATNNTQALRDDEVRSGQILERIPAGRWGTKEDMMGTIVFLASEASSYINGYTIAVDGGWLAR